MHMHSPCALLLLCHFIYQKCENRVFYIHRHNIKIIITATAMQQAQKVNSCKQCWQVLFYHPPPALPSLTSPRFVPITTHKRHILTIQCILFHLVANDYKHPQFCPMLPMLPTPLNTPHWLANKSRPTQCYTSSPRRLLFWAVAVTCQWVLVVGSCCLWIANALIRSCWSQLW